MTIDMVIYWGLATIYFCGFLSTGLLVTKRFFERGKDEPAIIIPVTIMATLWPLFWAIVGYGKLTGKA